MGSINYVEFLDELRRCSAAGDFEKNYHLSRMMSITLARSGLVLLGLTWLVFGVYSLIRISGASSDLANYAWIISGLMFINGGVLIWVGRGLREGRSFYFILALLVLAGNILLTFTDEFGVYDLVTLLIAIGIFFLLLGTRSIYLTRRQNQDQSAG